MKKIQASGMNEWLQFYADSISGELKLWESSLQMCDWGLQGLILDLAGLNLRGLLGLGGGMRSTDRCEKNHKFYTPNS